MGFKNLGVLVALLLSLESMLMDKVESYKIGLGRADVTGPSVEINFMGYANFKQEGKGIHLRQYARSFVVEDKNEKRIAFVSVDVGMMGIAVKREVIKRLQEQYGTIYTNDNVVISGTHTHSAPGGFLMHVLYDISILGFVPQTFEALVSGIYLSIQRATANMVDGKIYLSHTEILNVNINRSPTSYLLNPPEERAKYSYDVDKELTQLRFVDSNDITLGAFNWYAIHPTSMNNTNRLVSSDNVGYASIVLEKEFNRDNVIGTGKFVGAFCSSNLGDVSPNIKGPKCSLSGRICDVLNSKCSHTEGECIASGPGNDMFESTKIIGERLADGAMRLLNPKTTEYQNSREVIGDVNFIHTFIDMPNYKNSSVRGCLPAMGYSFAAGTTDGPGLFDFQPGSATDNTFWKLVRRSIGIPTEDDKECQAPKPILLATGRAKFPYEWQPKISAVQELQIGNVLITAVPGEFTTMAGRRLRKKVQDVAAAEGKQVDVILAGLSNLYTSYITTYEEYQAQRYEAASTIYGPYTHTIYMKVFERLTKALLKNEQVESGPEPPYLNDDVMSLNFGVIYDNPPIGQDYGYVQLQPLQSYRINDTVLVKFVTSNPRNDLLHEKTFLTVEHKENGEWRVVHTDASWDTKFIWKRTNSILGYSDAHIEWHISPDTLPGEYRISHVGTSKSIWGKYKSFRGQTQSFLVTDV